MDNQDKVTFRPKGGLYIFANIFIYTFIIVFLIVVPIYFILEKVYFGVALSFIPALFLMILQTKEVVKYKIDVHNDKIYIAKNGAILMTYEKEFEINLKELKSIQLVYGQSAVSYIMAVINLEFNNNSSKYINLNKFSKKQIYVIMNVIKQKAEAYNGYEVEIKPEINGFKKKKNNKSNCDNTAK